MMTKSLVRAIQIFHFAVIVFVLTACFLPWREVWIFHAIFVPLMVLHWKTNQNRCVLTQIEAKLKGEREEPSESGFIKKLIGKFFGKEPSAEHLQLMIDSILVVVWGITIGRILRSP